MIYCDLVDGKFDPFPYVYKPEDTSDNGEPMEKQVQHCRVQAPCRCMFDDLRRIVIPPDFCFDGASIPKPLWSIVGNPWEEGNTPGAIHDFFYSAATYLNVTRKQADNYLYEALLFFARELTGFTGWWYRMKARTFWFSVSVAGGSAWKKHRKSEATNPIRVARFKAMMEVSNAEITKWLQEPKQPIAG